MRATAQHAIPIPSRHMLNAENNERWHQTRDNLPPEQQESVIDKRMKLRPKFRDSRLKKNARTIHRDQLIKRKLHHPVVEETEKEKREKQRGHSTQQSAQFLQERHERETTREKEVGPPESSNSSNSLSPANARSSSSPVSSMKSRVKDS